MAYAQVLCLQSEWNHCYISGISTVRYLTNAGTYASAGEIQVQTQPLDQMATRLKAMTDAGGSIEAAQVKLIGLDEIRQAAGPRWPRMRERVRSGSISILSQFIGAEDVLIPAGDGFLIMLADSRAGDTQRRCQEMREALLKFYLGEDGLTSVRAEVKNHALTPAGLTDLIASSVGHGGLMVAKGHEDEIAIAPVLVTHDHRVGATLVAPIARNEKVRRIAHNPDFILSGRHSGDQDFLELDIALLDAALARIDRNAKNGAPLVTGVCVHATTLQSRRSRESYLKWLSQVDPLLRRPLFITINEIERGTPLMSISEWCVGLRTHVSRVSLNLHYADHAIGSIGATGAWAAGFHLPVFAGAQRDARAQVLRRQFGFWSKALRSQGMKLAVHGFQDAAFLEEARTLGVDLLTSDAHWPFEALQENATPH